MYESLVMTVLGEDRPGLVESVSELVAGHGANWAESRMAVLGGQFAGILRVQVEREQSAALLDALRGLDERGMTVIVHPTGEGIPAGTDDKVHLSLVGHDRPGIVREVAGAIAGHGINVEELETSCVSAPQTAQQLFRAEAVLRVPKAASVEALRADLERIGADLMVDFSLGDEPGGGA